MMVMVVVMTMLHGYGNDDDDDDDESWPLWQSWSFCHVDGDADYVDVVDDHRDDGEDYGYDHDSHDGNQ